LNSAPQGPVFAVPFLDSDHVNQPKVPDSK